MKNKLHTLPISILYQGDKVSVSVDMRFPQAVHQDIINIIMRNSGSTIEHNDTEYCRVYHASLDYPGCAIEVMKVACWYNHELGVELGEYDPIPCYMPQHMQEQG